MSNGKMTISAVKAAAAALLFLASGPASAAGLRTKFGEVVVRNLKIGQVYSLNKLLNLPLRVLNTGDEKVELKIEVIAVSSASVKQGYESIPDLSWVKLDKNDFSVDPNHEAVTDVIVSIPNDPKLLGRRFEADIWSHTMTRTGVFAVGMQSRLLIQVDSTPPTEEELKKKFVDRRLANLDFTLLPTVGEAENVPVGIEFDLKKERKLSIKLINPNDAALNFRVRSVPNWEALLSIPKGYEEAPSAAWLKPSEDVVKIEGNSIKEVGLTLNVPNDPSYRGKAFLFAVAVEILEQEIPARVYYKLLVRTAAEPAKLEKK
jgi:hypothetical protein